jgi:hypothetical protein
VHTHLLKVMRTRCTRYAAHNRTGVSAFGETTSISDLVNGRITVWRQGQDWPLSFGVQSAAKLLKHRNFFYKMGWCTGDKVTLFGVVSSCAVDTFQAVLSLLVAGVLTISYLMYTQSYSRHHHGRLSSEKIRATVASACVVVCLMSGQVILLVSELMAHTVGSTAWHHTPSKIFFHSAFVILYLLIALVILVGCAQAVPVPRVPTMKNAAFILVATFTLQSAVALDERAQHSASSAALIVPCLQWLLLLGCAVVVTVKCAPGCAAPAPPCLMLLRTHHAQCQILYRVLQP